MSSGWKGFEVCARTSLDCREGATARNTAVRGDSGQDAEREEEKNTESLHLSEEYVHHHKLKDPVRSSLLFALK